MNQRIRIPFHLGVDRHNRVPLGEGHPMLRSLRNLVLDDNNELVRRKAMEYRQAVLTASASSGGLLTGVIAGVASLPAGASAPVQPLCLWLPNFADNPNIGTALGRPISTVFRCANRENLLSLVGVANMVRMPATRRRPQSVVWRGGQWIACGDSVPVGTVEGIVATTGLIYTRVYRPGSGAPVWGVYAGMGVALDGAGGDNWVTTSTAAGSSTRNTTCRPTVIGTYRGRMVLGCFPPDQYGTPRNNSFVFSDFLPATRHPLSAYPVVHNAAVPLFGNDIDLVSDPLDSRSIYSDEDGGDLVAVKELSLRGDGALLESALIVLNEKSVYLMTGEPLSTPDVGEIYGQVKLARQPIADGCASAETICETPWGIIWAGHEDVYFMPNGGGPPVPIGRRIAKQLSNTPFDMQYLWHASYHEGYYRLAIMAPGQTQADPVAMEEEWRLDLRYGPPADWTQARWFGPQVFQPIGAPNGVAGDIYRGTFIQAVEQRTGFKKELFALQLGSTPINDNYAFVLCGLDGEETKDWACPFSPTQYRTADTQENPLAVGEKRVVASSQWFFGRQKEVSVGGASGLGEPAWTSDATTPTTDGAVTWAAGGKVATPGNWNDLETMDGEDALPSSRSNEILPLIGSMEFPSERPNGIVQFRGLEVGITRKDAATWAVNAYHDGQRQGVQLDYQGSSGLFTLGKSALGVELNDPIAPFSMWMDAAQSYKIVSGYHVAFRLAEYPYFTITDAQLKFSYYFLVGGSHLPYGATLDLSTTGYGFSTLKALLDVVVAALNASLAANSLPGSFSHNLVTNPAQCPVRVAISHDSTTWFPNCMDQNYFAVNGDNPSLWLQLGFEPVSPGIVNTDFQLTHSAALVAWQRKVAKLRIANLIAVLRSFKKGPT